MRLRVRQASVWRVSARQLSETPDQNLHETEKPRWPRTRETKPTRRDRCEVRQRSTLGRANPSHESYFGETVNVPG